LSNARKNANESSAAPKIFMSYATLDRPLAARITKALEAAGRDVWLDAEDISYAEDWKDVVLPAIERAPAFLFLTSRHSVTSQHCLEELAHAAALGKRIIPLVAEAVAEGLPEILQSKVRRDFRDDARFDEEMARLMSDVDSNPEYVDAHTHLANRAARWQVGKGSVLVGSDLKNGLEVFAFAQANPGAEPAVTPLLREFLQASLNARRKRRLGIGLGAVGLVAAIGLAIWLWIWWTGIPRAGIPELKHDRKAAYSTRLILSHRNLRAGLRAQIPDKRSRENLLLATWNLANLGRVEKSDESLHYIAEVIASFDIVAIQEVRAEMAAYHRILELLGPGWGSIETDINENRSAGQERLAFIFDRRKVAAPRLVGELQLREDPAETGRPVRTPYFASFEFQGVPLVLCNVHLRWGRQPQHRVVITKAIADELKRKVERGRDFPGNLVLMGDFQAGSANGQILDALDNAGFELPHVVRDVASNAFGSRPMPYDQFALILNPEDGLTVATGGVFQVFNFVYTDDQLQVYADGQADFSRRDYDRLRKKEMSDHLPKWLVLKVVRPVQ